MSLWPLTVGGIQVAPRPVRELEEDICLVGTRGDEPAWTLILDATGGHGGLCPRARRAEVAGELLLVSTYGEHERGATSHRARLHAVGEEGSLRWWRPWWVIAPIREAGGDLLILVGSSSRGLPADEPVAHTYRVDPRDGRVEREWELRLPPREAAALEGAAWPRLSGELLEVRRGRFVAALEARWRGGTRRIEVRLKG